MFSAQEIEQFILDAGIPVSGSAIRDLEGDGLYYVFVEVRRDARGRQEPANKTLEAVKAALEGKGQLVDFILTDGSDRC